MYSIVNFQELSASRLSEYIEKKIHAQIRISVAVIKLYIYKEYPCSCNCSTHYSLMRILFERLEEECEQVFRKESLILFPLITENEINGKKAVWKETLFTWLENYHQKILGILTKIQKLTHNYIVHPDTPAERKLCVQELYDLDQRIQAWIRLEDSVLYPKMHPHAFKAMTEAELEANLFPHGSE